jgi:hypothetical protein
MPQRIGLDQPPNLADFRAADPASLKDFVFEHADRLPSGVWGVPQKVELLFVAGFIPPTSLLT